MSAELWTVVGVGVALAGMQWRMHAALRQDLSGRVDGLGGRIDGLDARIDGLGARIDGLGGRIDGLNARLDAMQADLANVKERLARVEGILDLLVRGLHIEVQGGGTA